MQTLHFRININVNEDHGFSWGNPRSQVDLDFSVPVTMFNSKNFTAVIEDAVKEAVEKYPAAVAEFQKEEAEKEAAKQLEEAALAESKSMF